VSESRDRGRKPKRGASSGGRRGTPQRGRCGSGKGSSGKSSASRGGSQEKREGGQGRGSRDAGEQSRGSGRGRSSRDESSRRGGAVRGRGGRGDSGRGGTGSRDGGERSGAPRKVPAGAEGLPRHVVEALVRVTPAARQDAALAALGAASEAFAEGQYHLAVKRARHAKEFASRDSTIREILGLASYRVGDWANALRELRTYRRLSGETTHMPVEMDVLRAMDRNDDVSAVWEEFQRRGGSPAVEKEARVVYASYLIDRGDLKEAAAVAGAVKPIANPWPEDMRLWYVAARIAALRGDKKEARRVADTILLEDPSFPGLDELDRLIETGKSV